MSVNIIYKTTDKSEITDAMLLAAFKSINSLDSTCAPIAIRDMRKAMEAARDAETIERIEIFRDHYIICEFYPEGRITSSNGEKMSPSDYIPLGEAFIEMGKQIGKKINAGN